MKYILNKWNWVSHGCCKCLEYSGIFQWNSSWTLYFLTPPENQPEWDQHDLVWCQKSGSRSTEMEGNSGHPMHPMEQRGLDAESQRKPHFSWICFTVSNFTPGQRSQIPDFLNQFSFPQEVKEIWFYCICSAERC